MTFQTRQALCFGYNSRGCVDRGLSNYKVEPFAYIPDSASILCMHACMRYELHAFHIGLQLYRGISEPWSCCSTEAG